MRTCALFSFSTAIHCYIGPLWLIFLQNSHSLLYGIIVAYSHFQQPLIVIQDNCGLFSFSTSIHCYMRTCGLFSFSTAIHCYIGSLWLILLFNSHSLLYRIIVAYFSIEQPFFVICELLPYSPFHQPSIVIQDHCGLFSFTTAIHCYMRTCGLFPFSTAFIVICELVAYSPFQQPFIGIQDHCGLFSFSTAIHCYIGSLWLIFLQNSHSLSIQASVWLILLQNSHSLVYAKLWLIPLFNSLPLLYSEHCGLFSFSTTIHWYIAIIVAYSPFQQPFIVIQDHCGVFSFSTSTLCYMRTCALFSFSTAIHCYIGSLWLILLFHSHSMLYRIIVAYFRFQLPCFVIC